MDKIVLRKTGKIIKEYRIEAGYTQKQLAEELGLSKNYLSSIENNLKGVTDKNLEKISEVLNINAEDLSAINFYEAYRNTPPLIQMLLVQKEEYIEYLEEKIDGMKNEFERTERLKRLDTMLNNFYFLDKKRE